MRRLALAITAISLVTAELNAQGILGGRGRIRPDRPAEKPPLMPGVRDARAYSRFMLSRFSVEQAPMVSFLQMNGLFGEGIPSDYWTFGDATQLSVRATPSLFLNATTTSSALGGPFAVGSADVGVRVKPWTALRVTPYVDARYSWSYTAGSGYSSLVVPVIVGYDIAREGYSSGRGTGTVLGAGVETRLSSRLWLNTAVSSARYSMNNRSVYSADARRYDMTATRLTIGARYNPGQWLDAPR